MDGFFSLVVPVNNQVKDIAGLGFHGDKLFASLGGAADVVNQRQVPVRGQGGAATAGLAAGEQPQQGGKFFFIKGEGEAARAGTFCLGVTDGQVVGMDIADALRQKNFHPVAVCADHFHLRSVGELGERGLIKPRPGADVQLSTVCSHGAGLGSFLRAAGGDLDAIVRSGDVYLGTEQRGKQVGGLLAGQALAFIILRFACGCGFSLGVIVCVRLHAAGCFGGSFRQRLRGRVDAACKGGNRKDRDAEHHGQNCGQNPGNSSGFILHGHCPPVHGTL